MIFIILELLLVSLSIFLLSEKNYKLSYSGMFSLVLAISVPDLYYIPTLDLKGYFREMNIIYLDTNIHSLLYDYTYNPLIDGHKSSMIYNIFQWMIAKSGCYTLLPFLVALIVYSCLSFPSIYQLKNFHIDKIKALFAVMLPITLFPYWEVSNTVRWMLAAGIFYLITYLICLSKHRFLLFLLYIPLIFIHEAVLIPILLVAFCLCINKIRWYHYILMISSTIGVLIFIRYFVSVNTSVYSFIGDAHSYSGISGGKHVATFTNSITFKSAAIISVLVPILYSIGNIYFKRENISIYSSLENKLFDVFNVVDIMLLPDIMIYQRYVLYVGMIDIIFYLKILRNDKIINARAQLIYKMGFVLALIAFLFVSLKSMNFNFSGIINYVGMNLN